MESWEEKWEGHRRGIGGEGKGHGFDPVIIFMHEYSIKYYKRGKPSSI